MYNPSSIENFTTEELLFNPDTSQQTLYGKSILYIDDEYVSYLYFTELFSGTGATLIRASSYSQAIAYFTIEPQFCLVLISESLCIGMNARIVSQINNIYPAIPVIGIINNNSGKASDKFYQMECDFYINFHIDKVQLVKMVFEMLENRKNNMKKL